MQSTNNQNAIDLINENHRIKMAIRDLLALPVAVKELRYLDKGIGTRTENAAWLRAHEAVSELVRP